MRASRAVREQGSPAGTRLLERRAQGASPADVAGSEPQPRAGQRHGSKLLAQSIALSPAAVVVLGHDGRVKAANEAARQVAGWPHGSGPSAPLIELVHPNDRPEMLRHASRLYAHPGAVCTCQVRIRTAEGTYRHLLITAMNHVGVATVDGIVITFHDVTQASILDMALRRSEQLALSAEALAHMGSWQWRRGDRWPLVSPGLWRIVGLDPESDAPRPSSMLRRVHPDDVARVRSALRRSFGTKDSLDLIFRVVRPGGEIRHLRAVGEIEAAPDGSSDQMVGACLDITEAQEAHHRLQLQADVLHNVREAVIVTDLAGRVTFWNAGAAAIFGYSSEEMIGETLNKLYPEHSMPADALRPILEGAEFLGEQQAQASDGALVWVSLRASTMRDGMDRPIGAIVVATDVSDRRATADRLARLEAAVEQASDSVVIANARAEIEYVNPAFERITGYRRQDVIGKNPRILKSGRQPDSFYQAMWSALTAGQPWVADFTNRRQDGSLFEEEATISPIRDSDGEITGYVAVKRDITSERSLQTRAERLVRERALIAETLRGMTGRETPEQTAEAISRQVVTMANIATAGLFVFELDGRTAPYGFAVASGPAPALRRVPHRRTRYLRGRADEGPWIESWEDRPWHPYNEAFMRHGIRGIAYAPVRADGNAIGFLHISSSAENWQEQLTELLPALVEFAEIAGALIGPSVIERTAIEAVKVSIRRIVCDVAFSPVFQPIVDLERGVVVGYEALTRFADGTAPDVRFAEAQEVGMGARLEVATMQAAIDAARDLPPEGWLNLNASPQLILAGLRLHELLASTERQIILEITEHAAIADYDEFRRAIAGLGPQVKIAIDDAGAGYASLHHILELAPAFVKLDRRIVSGLDGDRARSAMVAGMAHFARSTGIRLIAEGVETEPELAALRGLGVDLAQGYLLGRPAHANEVRGGRVCRCDPGTAAAFGRPVGLRRPSKEKRAHAVV